MPLTAYLGSGIATLLVVEALTNVVLRRGLYELRDTLQNLKMAVGNVGPALAARLVALPIAWGLYQLRIWDLPATPWVLALLVVMEDHCYYWFHRASHRIGMFWAAHNPHHSSSHYNLSTALRLSWTTPWTGIPFWWVLPVIGFHPVWIVTAQACSLAFQFCLHTQLVDRLGPLEWVFNTPSHHRVHHGADDVYVDRNYGGVFIIWDRLYGTFQPETVRPSFGLVHPLPSESMTTVQFGTWRRLLRGVAAASSLRQGLGRLFGPPC